MKTIQLFIGIVFFSHVLVAQNQQNTEGGAKAAEGISFHIVWFIFIKIKLKNL